MRGWGKSYDVDTVTRHPKWGDLPGEDTWDVAIITLTEHPTGSNIKAGLLPEDGRNPGGSGWVTGWGVQTHGDPHPGLSLFLMGTEMRVQTDEEAANSWYDGEYNPDTHISVYSGHSNGCNGDSGGPLTIGDRVYGVASFVGEGCKLSMPTVYTRLGAMRDWICANSDNAINGC